MPAEADPATRVRQQAKEALTDAVTNALTACLRRGRNGLGVIVGVQLEDGNATDLTDFERTAIGVAVDDGRQEDALMILNGAVSRARAAQVQEYADWSSFQYEVPTE